MPYRLKGSLCAAAVCAAIGCAVWWLWPEPPAVAGRPLDDPQASALLAQVAAPAEATPEPTPAQEGPALELDALREICGPPWLGAFGPECVAALARRHAATPAVSDGYFTHLGGVNPALLGRTVTWGEVFEDAGGTLERVEAALARPECQPGERSLRLDLRAACAADDMARHAILHSECEHLLHRLGYSAQLSPDDDGAQELPAADGHDEVGGDDDLERRQRLYANFPDDGPPADASEHRERRDRLDERWFGAMWRAGKCRALPRRTFTALAPAFVREGHPPIIRKHKLIDTAARLGSDWAISAALVGDIGRGLGVDEQWLAAAQTERPALVELLRMWPLERRRQTPRREAKMEALAHATAAFALGQTLGVDIRPEPVVMRLRSMSFGGAGDGSSITMADIVVSMPHGARRLIELGWIVAVRDADAESERLYAHVDEVRDSDPWWEWWNAGRVSMRRPATSGSAHN